MGKSGEMLIDVKDRECGVIDALEEKIRQLKADNEALTNKLKYVTSQNLLMYVSDKEQKAEIETLTRKNNMLKIANKFLRGRMGRYRISNMRVTTTKENNLQKQVERLHVKNKFTESMLKFMVCFFVIFIVSFAIIEYFS